MDIPPTFLQYGERVTYASRSCIFRRGDPPGQKPFFFIIAGLVKLEFQLNEGVFPLWVTPDSLFGLVEPLAECPRLCSAHSMEKTIMYRWDGEGFYTATSVSWELAYMATTVLTRQLRILNAEFGERIRAIEGNRR
jgi:hypothetical protein